MRRVLCVWLPRLTTECLARSDRDDGRPVAAVVHSGTVVAAVSEAAEAAGVRAGMGWGDARARCPALLAASRDREREAEVMRIAARLVERYGPWVAPGADDLLIDVAGTAHLFGGERAMLEDCRRVFAERGWSARAAVAGGADAARGLAHFAGADLTIGAPDTVRALPVEALRLDDESAARLRRVGLRRIGDLASRSRTALADRFGERLIQRLDRMLEASGSGSEPLGAGPPPAGASGRLGGDGPPARTRLGRSALRHLAGEAVRAASPGRSRGMENGPRAPLRCAGGRAAPNRGPCGAGASRPRAVARPLSGTTRGVRSGQRSDPPRSRGGGGGAVRPRGRVGPGRTVGTSLGPARVPQRGPVPAGRPASPGGRVGGRTGAGSCLPSISCGGRRPLASFSPCGALRPAKLRGPMRPAAAAFRLAASPAFRGEGRRDGRDGLGGIGLDAGDRGGRREPEAVAAACPSGAGRGGDGARRPPRTSCRSPREERPPGTPAKRPGTRADRSRVVVRERRGERGRGGARGPRLLAGRDRGGRAPVALPGSASRPGALVPARVLPLIRPL